MFNAIKKFVSSHDSQINKNQPPPGVQAMGPNLQRRFAKGVQYNMKIIIKGDRNVGKSCLFLRLQGQKFKEEYIPTEEIQVTSIQWNYKATDDVVKVEVWDVVDKGKKRKKIQGLKIENSIADVQVPEEPALDAEFIDVYKGTNGVIMVLDITKQWTFAYIQRELPLIPQHIPVLVLANHRDMGHHRTVSEDQVKFFIDGLTRQPNSAQIRYAEGSMRNGFGLKYLHKFFNLPFLQLQRETLIKQLEINSGEIATTVEELDCLAESEEQNYDVFLDNLVNRRRQVAEQLSKIPNSTSNESLNAFSISQVNGISSEALHNNVHLTTPAPVSAITSKSVSVPINLYKTPSTSTAEVATPVTIVPPTPVLVPPQDPPKAEGSFISKIFNKSSSANPRSSSKSKTMNVVTAVQPATSLSTSDKPVNSVEDFVPEDTDRSFSNFLDDSPAKHGQEANHITHPIDSDSDKEGDNPLVAGYQDDLDPEDDIPTVAPYSSTQVSQLSVDNADEEKSNSEVKKKVSPPTLCIQSQVVPDKSELAEEEDTMSSGDTKHETLLQPQVPVVFCNLENEDLSILEHMYTNGRKPSSGTSSVKSRSSPSATGSEVVSEDSTSTKPKKHKHKGKNKEEEKSHRKTHKHKKHKEKETSEKEKIIKKKKPKSSSDELDTTSDLHKLEEFLGTDDLTSNRTGCDYEKF